MGDIVLRGNINDVINPVMNFDGKPNQRVIFIRPCVSNGSDNVWQYVGGTGQVSDASWTQPFSNAILSWIEANYVLPDGYDVYVTGGGVERDAEDIVASNLKFI